MRRKIFKILLWLTALLLLAVTVFAIILYTNKDKIQNILVGEINKSIETSVKVGNIDISLKKFPSASLLFKDVYINGVNSSESDTLLYARKVFFQFDLWKALTSDLVIDKIDIESSQLNIKLLPKGLNNFNIIKKSKNPENQIFTLEEITFNTLGLNIFDSNSGFTTSISIPKSTIKSTINQSLISLSGEHDLDIRNLSIKDRTFLKNLKTQLSLDLFKEDDGPARLTGTLKLYGEFIKFQTSISENETLINAQGTGIDLRNINNILVEQELFEGTREWSLEGKSDINFQYEQVSVKPKKYKLVFNSTDLDITHSGSFELHDVNISGAYAVTGSKDELNIEDFNGKSSNGQLSGKLLIKNFNSPHVNLSVQSDLKLEEWAPLGLFEGLEELRGDLDFTLSFKNQFRSFKNISARDIAYARSSGEINIDKASFRIKDSEKEIESLNGELSFANNRIRVNRLFLRLGESDVFLDGRFENVLGFALLDDQKLSIDCSLKSQNVDLKDFLFENQEASDSFNLKIAQALKVDLLLDIDRFKMNKFKAQDIKGGLNVSNGIISVQNLQLKSDEGSYSGRFTLNTKQPDSHSLEAFLNFDNINIHKLFVSFNNFGQDAILAKNIYGKVSGNSKLEAKLNKDLSLITESLKLESEIEIKNGRLKDYEPMKELSRFSDIETLKDVRFSSLKNHISISQSVITIPEMHIASNAIELHLKGLHNFDNIVDYRLKLKAGDALFGNRRATKPSEFDEHIIQKRGKDDPYIYIKMDGPIDDLNIALDKKSIGKSISEDISKQGKQLKNIFKKDKPDKKTDDPGIIYEWDEDDGG